MRRMILLALCIGLAAGMAVSTALATGPSKSDTFKTMEKVKAPYAETKLRLRYLFSEEPSDYSAEMRIDGDKFYLTLYGKFSVGVNPALFKSFGDYYGSPLTKQASMKRTFLPAALKDIYADIKDQTMLVWRKGTFGGLLEKGSTLFRVMSKPIAGVCTMTGLPAAQDAAATFECKPAEGYPTEGLTLKELVDKYSGDDSVKFYFTTAIYKFGAQRSPEITLAELLADQKGVLDEEEGEEPEAPDTTKETEEVSDKDEDGIPDDEDLCPDEEGVVEYQGCAEAPDAEIIQAALPDEGAGDEAEPTSSGGCSLIVR